MGTGLVVGIATGLGGLTYAFTRGEANSIPEVLQPDSTDKFNEWMDNRIENMSPEEQDEFLSARGADEEAMMERYQSEFEADTGQLGDVSSISNSSSAEPLMDSSGDFMDTIPLDDLGEVADATGAEVAETAAADAVEVVEDILEVIAALL